MADGAQLEGKGLLDQALAAYALAKDWDNAIRLASTSGRYLEAARFCTMAQRPYEAAVCFQRAGKLSECFDTLLTLPSSSPRYRSACVQAVRVASTIGRKLSNQVPFFLPFVSSRPTTPAEAAAMNQLADAFSIAEKDEQAKVAWRSVQLAYPNDPEAKAGLARFEPKSKPAMAALGPEPRTGSHAASPPASSDSGFRAAPPGPRPSSISGTQTAVPPRGPAPSGARPSAPSPASRGAPPVTGSRPALSPSATSKSGVQQPVKARPRVGQRLGEILLSRGSASADVLADLLMDKPDLALSDVLFADALVAGGQVKDVEIATALAEYSQIPFYSEAKLVADASPEAAKMLTLEQAERWNLVPVRLVNGALTVAFRDPRDAAMTERIRVATGVDSVIGVFATQAGILKGIARQYKSAAPVDDASERGAYDSSAFHDAPSPFPPHATPAPAAPAARPAAVPGPALASSPPQTHVMMVLPTVGSTFAGRYRIEASIGEGGSASVFKTTDLELGESVALKLFRPTSATEADNLVARFKLELSLSRQLTHKNIIRLFDLGSHDGWRYLTMELLQGADLMTVLERFGGALPLEVGLRYMVQICAGLELAHGKGVVHRDIKPQNIFITSDSTAKLMDFGLAKKLTAPGVSTTGMVAGTPEYISPEQINSFSTVTHLTDLYALGATAYTIFTGAPPFHGMELMPMLMAHTNQAPQPARERNPSIPPRLEAAMLKLLEKDPARRIQSAETLGNEMQRVLEEL